MKKILTIITICSACILVAGCDSYLDRQPDEALTEEAIFRKYETTLQYLLNVYQWLPDDSDPSGQANPFEGASDECAIVFPDRGYHQINRNTWSPSSNLYKTNSYVNMYNGIREASYFMQHVFDCPREALSESDAQEWYAEARFLRAYYYFRLMQVYGPVILLGDDPVDFNSGQLRNKDRSPWDVCVDYVCRELDDCLEWLPWEQPSNWTGRATKGAAMAVKARLLLYSARPLFNGNPLYRGLVNADSENLFPTEALDEKWERAAAAAKDIIDLDRYELIGEESGDPYTSLKDVFLKRANKELIFWSESYARPWRITVTPRQDFNGYGGVAPTQALVDAFAMKNGRYPITGYNTVGNRQVPIIDPASGYSESGFSSFSHPTIGVTLNTYEMYQDREPRFYINIFWSGLTWKGGNSSLADVQFYYGGNCGPGNSHNYSPTGYLVTKFSDPALDTKSSTANTAWGYISWPLFRYAEVLLNYAEALNELDPANPEILTCLNRVRTRAGLGNIESAYPEAKNDKEKMRELIRRERMVELCFENHRYFDTRTWMIAEQTNNGPVWGMNILNTNHDPNGDFWKRTPSPNDGGNAGSRSFTPRSYLFPILQAEIDRVNITQNYGW